MNGGAGVTGTTNPIAANATIQGEGFFEGFPVIGPPIRAGGKVALVLFAPGNEDLNTGGGACFIFSGVPGNPPADAGDADFIIYGQEDEFIGGDLDFD